MLPKLLLIKHDGPYTNRLLVTDLVKEIPEQITNFVAFMAEWPLYSSGGANLRSPIGGFANGMPRYEETSDTIVPEDPVTGPLLV